MATWGWPKMLIDTTLQQKQVVSEWWMLPDNTATHPNYQHRNLLRWQWKKHVLRTWFYTEKVVAGALYDPQTKEVGFMTSTAVSHQRAIMMFRPLSLWSCHVINLHIQSMITTVWLTQSGLYCFTPELQRSWSTFILCPCYQYSFAFLLFVKVNYFIRMECESRL